MLDGINDCTSKPDGSNLNQQESLYKLLPKECYYGPVIFTLCYLDGIFNIPFVQVVVYNMFVVKFLKIDHMTSPHHRIP